MLIRAAIAPSSMQPRMAELLATAGIETFALAASDAALPDGDPEYNLVVVDDVYATTLLSSNGRRTSLHDRTATYVLLQQTNNVLEAARWAAGGGGPVLSSRLPDSVLRDAFVAIVTRCASRRTDHGTPLSHAEPTGAPPRFGTRASRPALTKQPSTAPLGGLSVTSPPPAHHHGRREQSEGTVMAETRPWRVVRDALLREGERRYLESVLSLTDGRVGLAARRAGMSERALFEKMRRHQLRKEDFRHATTRLGR